jgi:hypothetical protein
MIRSTAPFFLALAALLAGCAPGPNVTAAPTGGATGTPAAQSPSLSSPRPSTLPPSTPPSPLASPAERPGFTTPFPPEAGTAWSGIRWRKLAPDDPLVLVRSITRWRGGFVALGGSIVPGDSWRTSLWVSTDGGTWRSPGPDVFGPSTSVISVGETADSLVALTLRGGADVCNGLGAPPDCSALAGPLQAWTSSDATSWTAHPGPAGIALPIDGCDGCGVAVPILGWGTSGVVAVNSRAPQPTGSVAAFSPDGIAWEALSADAFPSGFIFHDIAGFGSGFIGVGATAGALGNTGPGETVRAVALSSPDGRHWMSQDLPTAGLDPQAGSSADQLVAGPGGLIATGVDALVPGTELWWSSATGRSWSRLSGYPPLGIWFGQSEGSGMIPDGTLLGDGERMLAYRGGAKPTARTSADGRSRRTIKVSGIGPTNKGGLPLQSLILTPVGVLGTGDNGLVWFGEPVTSP